MGDEELPQPKISTVEIIIIGCIFVLFDAIGVILVVFTLDDFWILDAISSLIFLYLLLKGVPPFRQLVAWLLELVPWLGALPLLTIGWIATIWIDRHPESEAAKIAAVGTAVAGRYAGKVPVKGIGTQQLGKIAQQEGRAERWAGRFGEQREQYNLPPPYDAQGKPTGDQAPKGRPSETVARDQGGALSAQETTGVPSERGEQQTLGQMLKEPEAKSIFERTHEQLFPQRLEDVPKPQVRIDDRSNVVDLQAYRAAQQKKP